MEMLSYVITKHPLANQRSGFNSARKICIAAKRAPQSFILAWRSNKQDQDVNTFYHFRPVLGFFVCVFLMDIYLTLCDTICFWKVLS